MCERDESSTTGAKGAPNLLGCVPVSFLHAESDSREVLSLCQHRCDVLTADLVPLHAEEEREAGIAPRAKRLLLPLAEGTFDVQVFDEVEELDLFLFCTDVFLSFVLVRLACADLPNFAVDVGLDLP